MEIPVHEKPPFRRPAVSAMTEFLLDEIQTTPEGIVLHGIVNEGTVLVGSAFVAVRRQVALGLERSPPEQVNISVCRIVAYRHILNELPRGMSGGLLVDATNVDFKRGDMLFGPKKHSDR
jgi:hypothetical protein